LVFRPTSGAIFVAIKKGGELTDQRLGGGAVAAIIKRRLGRLGYDTKQFAGHSLRAGFVTSALDNDIDYFRIMRVTRHRNPNTLKGYDRRARAVKQHAGVSFL
jgi:hypothetical protein